MRTTTHWKTTKIVLYVLLAILISILFILPIKLLIIGIPYQVFLFTLLVFFIIYSKTIWWYYFISTILNLIEDGKDVYSHISEKLSKDSIQKYLLEWNLLTLVENMLIKTTETSSLLIDMTLLFLLWISIGFLSWAIVDILFYSVLFAITIVLTLNLLIELYVKVKFSRIFAEEIKEIEKAFEWWNTENKIEDKNENKVVV